MCRQLYYFKCYLLLLLTVCTIGMNTICFHVVPHLSVHASVRPYINNLCNVRVNHICTTFSKKKNNIWHMDEYITFGDLNVKGEGDIRTNYGQKSTFRVKTPTKFTLFNSWKSKVYLQGDWPCCWTSEFKNGQICLVQISALPVFVGQTCPAWECLMLLII